MVRVVVNAWLRGQAAADSNELEESFERDLGSAMQTLRNWSGASNFQRVPSICITGKILARQGALADAEEIARLVADLNADGDLPLMRSFEDLLAAEILVARGRLDEGLTRLGEAQALQDSFQIHESLAYAHELSGNTASAIEEYERMTAQRGRALVEGGELAIRMRNMIDWNLALYGLARLHDRLDQRLQAIAYYQRFVDNWKDGDRPPVWHEAKERLEALLEKAEAEPAAGR